MKSIIIEGYGHPGSHKPEIITQNADNRFVTDVQIDEWDSFFSHSEEVTGNPHAVTKTEVGLGNCDNTADIAKPVSTAGTAALALKADKAIFDTHKHNEMYSEDGTKRGAFVDSAGDFLLKTGVTVNNFSTDATLVGDSDKTIPTEKAVKGYTDNTTNAAKTEAATYADTQDTAKLIEAKAYTDTQDTAKLIEAKAYADTQDTAKLIEAKTYTDTQDVIKLAEAKTYTDNKFLSGVTQSLTFGGGSSGDVASMEVTDGIITNVTLLA